MKEPNFFIIGAAECGKTSMAAWLAEHPNIFISPIRELGFYWSGLNIGFISNQAQYNLWFKDACDEHIAVGEAPNTYIYSRVAVARIRDNYPQAKCIVMLRNPVEMACSQHVQQYFGGNEHICEFEKAWKLSPEKSRGNMVSIYCHEPLFPDYLFSCCSGEQQEQLFSIVTRDSVLVLLQDDVKADSRREYLVALSFPGVPDDGRTFFPLENPVRKRIRQTFNLGERLSFFQEEAGHSALLEDRHTGENTQF